MKDKLSIIILIISVGYRVKSNRGIQFRIWANKVLKEYIIKGHAINQQAKTEQLEDLKNTVKLLSNIISAQNLTADKAQGLLKVITDYTYALDTLDKYDYQTLEIDNTTIEGPFHATYNNAMEAIKILRDKFGTHCSNILCLPLLYNPYTSALCISDNEFIIKYLLIRMQKHHQSDKVLIAHILLFIEYYLLGNIKGL